MPLPPRATSFFSFFHMIFHAAAVAECRLYCASFYFAAEDKRQLLLLIYALFSAPCCVFRHCALFDARFSGFLIFSASLYTDAVSMARRREEILERHL